jgi:hypothetical protein
MTLAVGGVAPNQSCPRPLFDLAGRTQKWTIAKRTVPLAIFGPVGYGLRSGILGAPARATQAASPLLFGLLMDCMGIGVLAVSAGLSLSAFFALLMLWARPTAAPAPA